jgi:hypothetical protein
MIRQIAAAALAIGGLAACVPYAAEPYGYGGYSQPGYGGYGQPSYGYSQPSYGYSQPYYAPTYSAPPRTTYVYNQPAPPPRDRNRDGIADWRQRDRNRDGVADYKQRDRDRDGIPDYRDRDRNNDGVPDRRRTGWFSR